MMDQKKDVDALKKECIAQFQEYLKKVQKGYQPDYSHILNMICFINLYFELDNKQLITQYLLNYAKPYINICNKR